MKSRTWMWMSTVTVVAALAMPVWTAAQEQQQPNLKQPRYRVTDLGTLGGTVTVAYGINDRGWVEGTANLAGDQSEHAFLWRNGVMTDLGTLGGPNSGAFFSPTERGEVGGIAETLTSDPLGEDFCGFGDHLVCLPFLWQEGVMTPLPTLGGSNGAGKEVNNRGQIVGAVENSTQDPTCTPPQVLDIVPVIWEPKQGKVNVTQLLLLRGDTVGFALAINDNGQAVGITGSCADFYVHAVLWQNGAVIDLGNLGGTDGNVPLGINNQGQVVGFSDLPGDMTDHAFLWQNGVMTDLGTLPGDFASNGNGINNKGQVVGTSYDASGNPLAFLWQRGVMTDLNNLVLAGSSMFLLDAEGINSRGEIVGDALQVNTGEVHAYLATPCSPGSNENAGCEDGVESTTAAGGATGERPDITLPENVRTLLQQQTARRYHVAGQSVSFEANGNLKGTAPADGANGNGVISNLAGGPLVRLNPASLDFGDVGVGGKSSPETTTLTNIGNATLHITGITITGTDLGDFSQMNDCPAGLGAGNYCTITVTFAPEAEGPRSAVVSVSDNAPSPQQVPLSGTGYSCKQKMCQPGGGCGAGCECKLFAHYQFICVPHNDQLSDNKTQKDQQCSSAPAFPFLNRDLEWTTK